MTRLPGVDLVHYAVDTGIPWPTQETTVDFLGHKIILRPSGEDGIAPDIRMRLTPSMTDVDGIRVLLRFLSMISWWNQAPARIDLGGLTNYPLRFKIHCLPPPKCPDFLLPQDCQYPTDAKAQLAIALYREAMSVNNVFYKFLGFFKIINCYCDDRNVEQREWINSTVRLLKEHKAVERIKHHQSKILII